MLKTNLFLILAVLLFTNCSSQSKKPTNPTIDWRLAMNRMADDLKSFYPMVISEKEFSKPENFNHIYDTTQNLRKNAQVLVREQQSGKMKEVDADPSLKHVSRSFEKELGLALKGLRSEKLGYSRAMIKNAVNYCIQCHTRTKWGPEFMAVKDTKKLKFLKPFEKAEYYTALRRYDSAIKVYKGILKNEKKYRYDRYKWKIAVKELLNILVRVSQDPGEALKVVDSVENTPFIPSYFLEDVKVWRSSLKRWQKETKAKIKDNAKRLAKAKKLLSKAHRNSSLSQEDPKYIDSLRASQLLHDFLRYEEKSSQQAVALLYLGQSYENMNSQYYWNLARVYFKSCIQLNPHSSTAMACYDRYESNIYLNSMRSGGQSVSSALQTHLRELNSLARPLKYERYGDTVIDR